MEKIIAIEGADRIGKSTFIEGLHSMFSFDIYNFPDKSESDEISKLMVKMLSNPKFHQTHPFFKSLLFAIDRYSRFKEVIEERDYSNPKDLIVCDRYSYSNIAYQMGFAQQLKQDGIEIKFIGELVKEVEFNLFDVPRPDLIVCLTVGNEDFFERNRRSDDDLNDQSIELQWFVNRFFRNENPTFEQNIKYWLQNENLIIIDVLKEGTLEFKDKEEILNDPQLKIGLGRIV
jgi:thymidylate kinase